MDRVLFAPPDLPVLPPAVAHDWRSYDAWVRAREERRTSSAARGPSAGPVLHLIMLIGGAPPPDLSRTFRGFHRQTSRRWSMTVVVAEPWGRALQTLVDGSASRRVKRRLRTVTAPAGTPA